MILFSGIKVSFFFPSPLNHDERSSRNNAVVSCPGPRDVLVSDRQSPHAPKKFSFDRVFNDASAQPEVYKAVVQPLIKQVDGKFTSMGI